MGSQAGQPRGLCPYGEGRATSRSPLREGMESGSGVGMVGGVRGCVARRIGSATPPPLDPSTLLRVSGPAPRDAPGPTPRDGFRLSGAGMTERGGEGDQPSLPQKSRHAPFLAFLRLGFVPTAPSHWSRISNRAVFYGLMRQAPSDAPGPTPRDGLPALGGRKDGEGEGRAISRSHLLREGMESRPGASSTGSGVGMVGGVG